MDQAGGGKEAGPVPLRGRQIAGTGTFSGGRNSVENTIERNDDENNKYRRRLV